MPQQRLTQHNTTETNTAYHDRDLHSMPQQGLTQYATSGTNTVCHNKEFDSITRD